MVIYSNSLLCDVWNAANFTRQAFIALRVGCLVGSTFLASVVEGIKTLTTFNTPPIFDDKSLLYRFTSRTVLYA